MKTKKIMILGGGENQIPLIKEAKKLGIYTIVCDYDENCLGKKIADKFYNVSIMDKKSLIKIGKKEEVNGVTTTSEPAMPISEYVSEKIGVSYNPYESIKILSNKNLFRKFLKENGFNSPNFKIVYESEEVNKLKYPLMVKPIDSSGSRGVNQANNKNELKKYIEDAKMFSKTKKVIIEEYIEPQKSIGGDIFIYNGHVIFKGLMDDVRSDKGDISPFIPIGKTYPTTLSKQQQQEIIDEIEKVMKLLKIKYGAFNVEIIINENKIYFIEINPRHGGNNIPELLEIATGINQYSLNLKSSLGLNDIQIKEETKKYVGYYIIYSNKEGFLYDVKYSNNLKNKIVKEIINIKKGEKVYKYTDASKKIGTILLKFENQEDMNLTYQDIKEEIKVNVEVVNENRN